MKNRIISVIVISLFFLLGSAKTAKSQDVLILKTGKEMKVNIIEESSDIVKYREVDNPGGPLFSIGKDKVSSIKYKKGSKDVKEKNVTLNENAKSPDALNAVPQSSTPVLSVKQRHVMLDGKILSSRKVKTIMEDNPEAVRLYESGLTQCNISNGCAASIVLVSFITSQIANGKKDNKEAIRVSAIGLGIDGAFLITGIVLASTGKHKIRSAVSLYNSSVSKPVSYKIDFGLQDHGVGFAMKF